MPTDSSRPVDLHCHSSASTGARGLPTKIPEFMVENGYAAFALTEHNSLDSLDDAVAAAGRVGIEYVPGVEVSSRVSDPGLADTGMDILGYYVHRTPALEALLAGIYYGRHVGWIMGAINQLREDGIDITDAEAQAAVTEHFGAEDKWKRPFACVLGVGAVLQKRGLIQGPQETVPLLRRLSPRGALPPLPDATEVCRVLREAGAVVILAHPGVEREASDDERLRLEHWLDHYVDGLEVYTPKHSPAYVAMCEEIVRRRGCPFTGGSDRHEYGDPHLRSAATYACVESLQACR